MTASTVCLCLSNNSPTATPGLGIRRSPTDLILSVMHYFASNPAGPIREQRLGACERQTAIVMACNTSAFTTPGF